MRIDGWRLDGFGCLKDYRVDDLGRGVTVVLGENEAGKSTLLGYLRAILFGFPKKSTSERQYPPLRGGRHGGEVFLRDGHDALWTLQRYADGAKKTVALRAPDGREADPDELRRLLGNVDGPLFKSVFAFSLAELQDFATLDEQGVRDRIFSAGVSGAGKSAGDVIKKLDQRTAGLLKQGAGRAEINDLVRAINEKQGDLAEAERLAGGYAALIAQDEARDAEARELWQRADPLQARISRLEDLIELHPQWLQLGGLRDELEGLPEVSDEGLPDRVAALVGSLAGQRVREERMLDLQTRQATAAAVLERRLELLGPGWDVKRVRAFDDSLVVRDEVGERAGKLEAATAAAEASGQERARLAGQMAELEAERDRIAGDLPGDEPPAIEALEQDDARLAGLWTDVRDLQNARIVESAARPGAPLGRRVGVLAAALAALCAVAAVGGFVAGYGQLGVGFVFAAALLAVVAVAALAGGRPAAATGATVSGDGMAPAADETVSPHGAHAPVVELERRVARAAESFGLPPAPSATDLEAVRVRLSQERTRRVEWDRVAERLRDVDERASVERRKAETAAAEAERLESARESLEAEWMTWLDAHGLPKVTSAGALDLLGVIAEARGADVDVTAAAGELAAIEDSAAGWDDSAREALVAAGRTTEGLDRDTLRAALATLDGELRRRKTALDESGRLERAIATRLGGGRDGEAAMTELAEGDVPAWQDERRRLTEESAELGAQRDQAIEGRTRARQEREGIEQSADIPRLQAERESLKAELAARVREYRVVATARGLIAGTLRSFVRERQPAVLARASGSFARVTAGRYTAVEQDEGGKESVVVVSGDQRLTPDQLSRGTAEQLYLTIRLALVGEFAQRSEPLPLIMDDCLVNFDPRRAEQMARLLVETSRDGQCLLFTCHPETVELVTAASDGLARVIDMGQAST